MAIVGVSNNASATISVAVRDSRIVGNPGYGLAA
jgi:hypothetical protein